MTTSLMPEPRQRYFDSNGQPLSGGLLYTYAAGTNTPKATFTDSAGTTPSTNPIVLDANGEALIFWSGSYKVNVTSQIGVQIGGYPVDNYESVDNKISVAVSASESVTNGAINDLSNSLQLVDYAALRASTTMRTGVYVTGVLGSTFAGIAGAFLRDNSDTTSPDNGGTIIVRSDGVRFKRVGVYRMDIDWFGAIAGSATTNNSPMIQAAINAAKNAVVGIYIPSKTGGGYKFDDPLFLPQDFVGIKGDSMFFSMLNYTGTGTAISFSTISASLGIYSDFQLQSGLPGESIATRRALNRNGISWKCYGGQGHVSNVKIYSFNGYGSLMEAIWDSRVEGLLVESCGGNNYFACGVINGTDTSNHTTFLRLQVEDSRGQALYFEGLDMHLIALHSERTAGDGINFTHVILGDVTFIGGRIEDTTNVKIRIGIATGSMQNVKCFSGPTYFEWGARLSAAGRIQDCIFGDVFITNSNLRHYDFTGGSMASLTSSYAEKQTTLTGVNVAGPITLSGSNVRLNIYDGTVTGNIITSGGGSQTVEAHDSDLAYFPTVETVYLYNCTVDTAHQTPGAQKARSYDCIFFGEITIQSNNTKWQTQGCEYKNGITLGAGSPGWKFGKGDWVSAGSVSAGLLLPPTGSSAAFANGEYCSRILKTVGQPQGWFCTTAGVSPTLAFTSEGNL